MTRIALLASVCACVAVSACVVVEKPAQQAAPPAAAPAAAPARAVVAQPSADGKPAAFGSGEGGIWIWRDGSTWHLRTTTKGKHQFTGKVAGQGAELKNVQSARVEAGDKIRVNDGKVEFVFSTEGAQDGFDFVLEKNACAKFDLLLDGSQRPDKVIVGKSEQHPQSSQFTACP